MTDPVGGASILRNPSSEMRFSGFQMLRQGVHALEQPYFLGMAEQVGV